MATVSAEGVNLVEEGTRTREQLVTRSTLGRDLEQHIGKLGPRKGDRGECLAYLMEASLQFDYIGTVIRHARKEYWRFNRRGNLEQSNGGVALRVTCWDSEPVINLDYASAVAFNEFLRSLPAKLQQFAVFLIEGGKPFGVKAFPGARRLKIQLQNEYERFSAA